jgi:hypothetical protein
MCYIINKIKSFFSPKKQCCSKQCCNEFENNLLKKAALSQEEVDGLIVNALKKVKQKKVKPRIKKKIKKTKK